MVKRIKAINSTLSTLFIVVELLIGVKVLVYSFGSGDTISWVMQDVGQVLDQLGYGVSTIVSANSLNGPAAFLMMVLGFMIFSYFFIAVMLPRIEKQEEDDIEMDFYL